MATGKLYNIGHISSNIASGGTIKFHDISSPGAANLSVTALNVLTLGAGSDAGSYHTHTGLSASPGGSMTANIGANDNYGISGLAFCSSLNSNMGNVKGTWVGEVIGDAYIANDISLDNITQITNRSHTNLSDIGTNTHAQIDSALTNLGVSGEKWYSVYQWMDKSGNQFDNWLDSGNKLSGWFFYSSMKLSESGAKYSELYTWYGGTVSSQQYTNWLQSGQKLSDWYKASSMKLSESGQKYSDLYTWYGVTVSSQQYPNWLASGEKLSRWYKNSAQALGETWGSGEKAWDVWNWYNKSSQGSFAGLWASGEKWYETWKWYSATGNQFDNWLDSGEKLSRWFSESSQILGNVTAGFYPSMTTRRGWASITDAGTIAHGVGAKPTWVGLSPSGASPLVYSFIVDASNITVYHTSPDTETFSWVAMNATQVTGA